MTTAHRATWRSARGGNQEEGSFRLHVGTAQVSAKAAPGNRVLKTREDVATTERVALRAALEAKESGKVVEEELSEAPTHPERVLDGNIEWNDGSFDEEVGNGPRKRPRLAGANDDESEDDDSEDDDAALLAELEKIRAERAVERERREQEEREELEHQQSEAAAAANPLLGKLAEDDTASVATATTHASFAVKRRWNDDVIFKNQAKGERRTERRFVNDTIRNDYHRRFLKRYMR